MYTQKDREDTLALLRKRWWITTVPAILVFAIAVALFIYGQNIRSEKLWMGTAALSVLAGGYFLFFYGVYVRPARIYLRHLNYMLDGHKRETTGVFKSFDEQVSNREGIECHAMFINIGDKNDPVDDRLFYYDSYKPSPTFEIGTRVTVVSNDKMVSDIKTAF